MPQESQLTYSLLTGVRCYYPSSLCMCRKFNCVVEHHCEVVLLQILPSPPVNRQACFLTCWLKISAGKSVELSKVHNLNFSMLTRQTAKSMQILFCFFRPAPLAKTRRFCLFRKFHTFSVWHAESAYLRSKYIRMVVHFIFPYMPCSIVQGNTRDYTRDYNISQFSGSITGKLSIVNMSLPLLLFNIYCSYFPQTLLVANVPSSTSKCTIQHTFYLYFNTNLHAYYHHSRCHLSLLGQTIHIFPLVAMLYKTFNVSPLAVELFLV